MFCLVKLDLVCCKRYRLKVGISTSKKVGFICINERPLKMTKNACYLMLKVLSVLEIFTFLSRLFGYVEKRCNKKANVNFTINSNNN